MSIQPFEIDVPQATLDDLRARLAATRPVPEREVADWRRGHQPRFSRRAGRALAHHVRLARARGGAQSLGPVPRAHRGHHRSFHPRAWPRRRAAAAGAHPWLSRLVPALLKAHPAADRSGGARRRPGRRLRRRGAQPARVRVLQSSASIFAIGDLWHALMTDKLGYGRFGAHGGDWGSTISASTWDAATRRPWSASTSRTSRSGMPSGARAMSAPTEQAPPPSWSQYFPARAV